MPHSVRPTISSEERAIKLIQEILGVSRESADHTYMLIEARLTSLKMQNV
jgi:hypothetical protein